MNKTIKVRTSYTGCPYITAGKVYEATIKAGFNPRVGRLISFVGDDGWEVITCELDSCHIGDQDWEILPEGPSIADELAEALEAYQAAGFGNSIDHVKHGAAYDKAVEALAKYKESK